MERPSDCLEPAASGAVGLGHQAGSMPEPDMGRGNGAALTSLKVAWGAVPLEFQTASGTAGRGLTLTVLTFLCPVPTEQCA